MQIYIDSLFRSHATTSSDFWPRRCADLWVEESAGGDLKTRLVFACLPYSSPFFAKAIPTALPASSPLLQTTGPFKTTTFCTPSPTSLAVVRSGLSTQLVNRQLSDLSTRYRSVSLYNVESLLSSASQGYPVQRTLGLSKGTILGQGCCPDLLSLCCNRHC